MPQCADHAADIAVGGVGQRERVLQGGARAGELVLRDAELQVDKVELQPQDRKPLAKSGLGRRDGVAAEQLTNGGAPVGGSAACAAATALDPEPVVYVHGVCRVGRPVEGVDRSGHEREEGWRRCPTEHSREVGENQRAERHTEEGDDAVGKGDVAKRVRHVLLVRHRAQPTPLRHLPSCTADPVKVGELVAGDGRGGEVRRSVDGVGVRRGPRQVVDEAPVARVAARLRRVILHDATHRREGDVGEEGEGGARQREHAARGDLCDEARGHDELPAAEGAEVADAVASGEPEARYIGPQLPHRRERTRGRSGGDAKAWRGSKRGLPRGHEVGEERAGRLERRDKAMRATGHAVPVGAELRRPRGNDGGESGGWSRAQVGAPRGCVQRG